MAMIGTVTFDDGSTCSGTLGVFPADNGDTFMLVLNSQPDLASQGIDTIILTSPVNADDVGIERTAEDDHEFVRYGPGTRLATPLGPKRADELMVGDDLTTLDDGPQPIRWVGKRRLRLAAPHPAQPVRIGRGTVGSGLPKRDLILSPNHRVLLDTSLVHALHDPLGALAPAKALTL